MADGGEMLLTVFLKHRQSMNLAEINQKLEQTGFWRKFPPEGVEVVSWCVMMGIGQVVTLRLPADQQRAVSPRRACYPETSRTPPSWPSTTSWRPAGTGVDAGSLRVPPLKGKYR